MHVALIDFNFFEYTISLANALAREGVRVSLLAPTSFAALAGALSPAVQPVYFDKPRLRSAANLRMLFQIESALRRLRPDAVHLVAVNPWLYLWFTVHRRANLVTTIHDPVMHAGDRSQRNIPQAIRDLPLRFSPRLIVHGQALKEMLLARSPGRAGKAAPLAPERIAVTRIGELSIYRHWDRGHWPEREGTLLFFGRIWPYKGLDTLIAAEPAISAACPQARFVIAGQGEDLARYRAAMVHPERFEVQNRYIPRAEVPRLFQEASLVVLPYHEASQSAVVPLAYAFGRPVVATAVGGIPEVVTDGRDGLLVPPRDAAALAQAAIRLLQDRALRRRLGRAARQKCEQELSWRTIARRTMAVYRSVAHA